MITFVDDLNMPKKDTFGKKVFILSFSMRCSFLDLLIMLHFICRLWVHTLNDLRKCD